MTTREVADRFGVAVSTVCRWVAAGRLPEFRKMPGVHGPRLFDPDAVERFAASR